jgi:DNA-binding FadR family transcriptional regulator
MKASIGDPEQVAAADIAFHLGIAEASSNDLIFDLLTLIRSQLEKGLMKVSSFPGASENAWKEHVLILNAIRDHNAETAKALMRDHIGKALKRYVEAHSAPALVTK